MTHQDELRGGDCVATALSKAEVMNALGAAASLKSGLRGEYAMTATFRYTPDGELSHVIIVQRPLPEGGSGQPPILILKS